MVEELSLELVYDMIVAKKGLEKIIESWLGKRYFFT